MLVDYIVWKWSHVRDSFSNSTVFVRVPVGTALPALGTWRRDVIGGDVTYTLDTSQPMEGGWLAWAVEGPLLRVAPEDGLQVRAPWEGSRKENVLLVCYVRPGTAVLVGHSHSRRRRLSLKFISPGESCRAYAKDFAATAKTLRT